jgi:hypothetical protein
VQQPVSVMMSGEEPRGGVTQAAIGIRLGEGGWVLGTPLDQDGAGRGLRPAPSDDGCAGKR